MDLPKPGKPTHKLVVSRWVRGLYLTADISEYFVASKRSDVSPLDTARSLVTEMCLSETIEEVATSDRAAIGGVVAPHITAGIIEKPPDAHELVMVVRVYDADDARKPASYPRIPLEETDFGKIGVPGWDDQ